MRDRTEQILRVACLILATLVLAQLIRTSFHVSPFFGVKIPAIPTLETNVVAGSNQTPPTHAPLVATPATNHIPVTNRVTASNAIQTANLKANTTTNVVAKV